VAGNLLSCLLKKISWDIAKQDQGPTFEHAANTSQNSDKALARRWLSTTSTMFGGKGLLLDCDKLLVVLPIRQRRMASSGKTMASQFRPSRDPFGNNYAGELRTGNLSKDLGRRLLFSDWKGYSSARTILLTGEIRTPDVRECLEIWFQIRAACRKVSLRLLGRLARPSCRWSCGNGRGIAARRC
jgi:hypothetical protein